MFFTVIEIQDTGSAKACLPTIFVSFDEAKSGFFSICHSASQSGIPYHAVFILSDEGQIVKGEIFDRRSKG